jgi:hypothetical protein
MEKAQQITSVKISDFALRHFDPKFGGTKILNMDPKEFEQRINWELHAGTQTKNQNLKNQRKMYLLLKHLPKKHLKKQKKIPKKQKVLRNLQMILGNSLFFLFRLIN